MSENMTVVGERSVVKGSLQGDEDLTVYGRVEGGIHLTKTLIIESSGIVLADIEVRDAIISGVVVGNITASNSVQITEEGRMVGDITSPRFIIVDGASYKGHVDMGSFETSAGELPAAPSRSSGRVARPAAAPSRPAAVAARPAPAKPAPARPEPPRPVLAKPAKPEPEKPEPVKAEPAKPERPAKAEPVKAEPAKPQVPARPAGPKVPPPGARDSRKPPKPPTMPAGKRKVRRR